MERQVCLTIPRTSWWLNTLGVTFELIIAISSLS